MRFSKKHGMDSNETLQKYQMLRKQFERNGEDRLELENERNEILKQKTAAVREKWLQQLGKCSTGSSYNGLEKKFAHESIQETIDLCHLHLKGLENDLTRLEDTRKSLIKELESLKGQSRSDLSQLENNSKEIIVRITNYKGLTLSPGKRRRRISSKDEPISPTGLERRYELQRKIDEELRKLQLAEKMAQEQAAENRHLSNDVAIVDYDPKNDECQQSQASVECSNDVNGLQSVESDTNNDGIEPSVAAGSSPSIIRNEKEHHTVADQIGDVNEFHMETSEIGENPQSVAVVTTDCDYDILVRCPPAEELESDSIPRSSAMTSPSTATGTLLREDCSQETESEEIVHQLSPDLDILPTEEAEPAEITATKDALLIELTTDESLPPGEIVHQSSQKVEATETDETAVRPRELSSDGPLPDDEVTRQPTQQVESATVEATETVEIASRDVPPSELATDESLTVDDIVQQSSQKVEIVNVEVSETADIAVPEDVHLIELTTDESCLADDIVQESSSKIVMMTVEATETGDVAVTKDVLPSKVVTDESLLANKVIQQSPQNVVAVEELRHSDVTVSEDARPVEFSTNESIHGDDEVQQKEVVSVEIGGYSEITAPKEGSLIDLRTDDSPVKPDTVQGSSVDPEVPILPGDVMIATMSQTSMVDPVKDQLVKSEKVDADIWVANQNPETDQASWGNDEDVLIEGSLQLQTTDAEIDTSPEESNRDDISDSENGTTEHSTVDGKQSSDEEEYSGFDIDMGGSLSYYEEAAVASDVNPTTYGITQACDDENNPIFADVKYSVGEQITTAAPGDDVEAISSPNTEYSDIHIAPWDSSGQIVMENPTVVRTDSLPSDKADSASSSRSTVTDSCNDEETKAVAEKTVANAMKAAYEIYAGEHAERDNFRIIEEETATLKELGHSKKCDFVNTNEEINTIESSSSSCTSNEGAETNSSRLVITTLRGDNDSSPEHETKSDNERSTCGVAMTVMECSAEENVPTALNDSRSNDDEPRVDLLITTAVSPLKNIASKQDGVENKTSTSDVQNNDDVAASDHENNESNVQGETTMKEQQDLSKNAMDTQESDASSPRKFPERITYHPALSQRNTEATKWFGQPTSDNKVSMKPSGRLDTTAEMERKRLIKAMTRKHSPNLVPKWEPPKEKDLTEDLDEKHKESLKKYEERRKSRSFAPMPKESMEEVTPTINQDLETPPPTTELPRENIVIESVVHSKDAINVWESRLHEKYQKEKLEKQRLSIGKQTSARQRATSEVVTTGQDTTPSSTVSEEISLPSSEYIERQSVDISKIRNRWKNMDQSNKFKQPEPVVKKEKSARRSTFTVNSAPAFRSSQSPAPVVHQTRNVQTVNAKPAVRSVSRANESPIDREIREAAEREEKWKEEQWEKSSEISAVSSEEIFPDGAIKTTNESATMAIVNVTNDSKNREYWKDERSTPQPEVISPTNDINGVNNAQSAPKAVKQPCDGHKEIDSESLSSYGSGTGNAPSSPRSSVAENPDKNDAVANSSNQECFDSGIDESHFPAIDITASPSATAAVSDLQSLSLDIGTSRVTKNEVKKSLSPTTSLHPVKEVPAKVDTELCSSQSKPESTTAQQSLSEISSETAKLAGQEIKQEERHESITHVVNESNAKKIPEIKKGGPIFLKKSGGRVEVSSSKSQLHTIMAREMEDAAAREAEWKRKQIELVNKGVDLTAHPVVHSTREIRTPASTQWRTPSANSSEQNSDVILRRPVRSLFDDDDEEDDDTVSITTEVSDEFKKREVVKAMRVPKRKSLLAMRWEEGQFKNTLSDDED